MSEGSDPTHKEDIEVTAISQPENEEEGSYVPTERGLFGSVGTMINRVWRAIRLDKTLYDELKTDPRAASDSHKVILILGGLSALLGLLMNDLQIGYILFFFLYFIVYLYIYVILTWFVGKIILRKDSTFDQVRVALAYALVPNIFFNFPYPWKIIGFWVLVTLFPAIRKTLGVSIISTIIIIVGAEIINEFITPIIIPYVFDVLFTLWVSGQ